jgi:undecaprenyl-phosphate 4-deoxy-4-formamido-L-arabinose transferase
MSARPACSLVIPVFNGAETIGAVVEGLLGAFAQVDHEVVLVDDGSQDASARVCRRLADANPETVRFVGLARNFGEHNAVLAGLRQSRGDVVVVLDDDGQHPASEARRLFEELRRGEYDIVYGRPGEKHHGQMRNLGSRLHDRLMQFLLHKPRGLYLSSFKAMNRFLVDEIGRYRGAWPYIDGLVLWATTRIGQLDVRHDERAHGRSNYRVATLVGAWLRAILSFSILPLRLAVVLGFACALLSGVFLCWIIVDRLFFHPELAVGLPTLGVFIAFFAGVQLIILGAIGEYLGRLFLFYTGVPQYVVREVVGGRAARTACPDGAESDD